MLRELRIANEASYSIDGQTLSGLKETNFIFGANGSGKTTISRVIDDPTRFPKCSAMWDQNRRLECLVYNTDFVAKNFSSQLPGIFTLGEADAHVLSQIGEAKRNADELQQAIGGLEATLGASDGSSGIHKQLRDLRAEFETECWKIKTKHDQHFKGAFEGLRNSKAKFCDRILVELNSNHPKLSSLEDLQSRAATVFGSALFNLSPIVQVSASKLTSFEKNEILSKKIVGKSDLDISALIKRLGNSDWVRRGREFLKQEGDQCPFCQQTIDEEFRRKLGEYFDETYLRDMDAIQQLIDEYEAESKAILETVDEAIESECQFLDLENLRLERERLTTAIELNKRLLERKRSEPSTVVRLDGLTEIISKIFDRIKSANEAIARHNLVVENISNERIALAREIWGHLLDESKDTFSKYQEKKGDLDKAISGLTSKLAKKNEEFRVAERELIMLEKSTTSVQPTVTAINGTLASFGFTNFKLATTGKLNNLYAIVRRDGSDASATLSEGERSFITFLYFYHLVRGSITASGVTNDRVVVIDDPVSSLDSDVLFIVSTLIKQILEEASKRSGNIKQVIVLTHNIYFHKEVTFDQKRGDGCRAHETFWIIRKVSDCSQVQRYEQNPIKTSYELLWTEVRNPGRSKTTIQNVLRRILENYFKILGNLDKDDIAARFDGRDQQICNSLFSWVNDGSHSFSDDLYISADDAAIERYLDVFRRIFEKMGHEAHYRMMMGPHPSVAVAPNTGLL